MTDSGYDAFRPKLVLGPDTAAGDPPPRPAVVQAGFLRALADHMEAHPWLTTVTISYYEHSRPGFNGDYDSLPVTLHLSGEDDSVDDFTTWAASLETDTYDAELLSGHIHFHAYGELASHGVEVFHACPAGTVKYRESGHLDELEMIPAKSQS